MKKLLCTAMMIALGIMCGDLSNSAEETAVASQKVEVEELRVSSESGDAEAMFQLGICYQIGKGVEIDWGVAEKWYRKAATLGNSEAMNQLGICCDRKYRIRIGEEALAKGISFYDIEWTDLDNAKELIEGIGWYRKAASMGNASGMFSLALCYQDGRGVTKNDAEAVKWYSKAAEAGDSHAMCNLACRYIQGKGVERDKSKAINLLKKAVELGGTGGEFALDELRRIEQQGDSEAAEQDGADQPATAAESKSEGKEKPKPESKVRPQ